MPSQEELKAETGIYGKIFCRHFGNYTKALRASGFEGRGAGFTLGMDELFQEWAGIVRKIGEVPSAAEYVLHSQHSLTPLRKRFRYWNDVPAGMVQYADRERAGRAMGRRVGSSKEVQAGSENRGMETHAGKDCLQIPES